MMQAIYSGNAYDDLIAAGADRVVTCNSVPHVTNMIDVTGLLSDAIRQRGFGGI